MRTSREVGVPREGALCEAVEVLGGLVVHDGARVESDVPPRADVERLRAAWMLHA